MAKEKAPARAAKEGYALLAAPEGVTGASAGGESYVVTKDGLAEVRAEHVVELRLHGFRELE